MISRFAGWVNSVNTTAWRIVVSITMAFTHAGAVLIAMLAFGWEPTVMQMKVLTGDAAAILTMMGFDVLQFISKRRTDAEYIQAKQGPSPVTAEGPSTVIVNKPETPRDTMHAESRYIPDKPAAIEVRTPPLVRED